MSGRGLALRTPTPGLDRQACREGGDPMPNPRQLDPDSIRVALDHGEVVELDGGTLVLNGEESPSVVLRLAPWRARSVARVLAEWSSVWRIFHPPTRPHLDELDLSYGPWRWLLRRSAMATS